MDILTFAMEKEKYAESFYRELAGKTDHPGLQKILISLADDEKSHYEVIEKLKSQHEQIAISDVIPNAKEIFAKMKKAKENFDLSISQIDLYKKARVFEKQSMDFYTQKAQESEDGFQKEILETLANEEKKHYFLLDHIVQFLSEPQTWLENAEFNRLDEF